MDGLVVVEHLDTGLLTLHRDTCRHLRHAMITHRASEFWLKQIDRECAHCHPRVQEEGT